MALLCVNLRKFRESSGLTQEQVARQLGGKISGQQIAKWERGDSWIGAAELKLVMDVYQRPLDHAFVSEPPWITRPRPRV